MRKIAFIISNCLLLIVLLLSFVYKRGLVSNPIGQFTGFMLNHQHTGWGTSLYYPKIDPFIEGTNEVRVGIIDSGISELSLDEFNVKTTMNFSNSSSEFDLIGHGTKVSSIIGAKNNHVLTLGVYPKSSLYSYKVVDDNGHISNDYIIQAFKQAISDKIEILNLSMVLKNVTPELKAVISEYINTGGYLVTVAYDLKDINFLNPISDMSGVISVGCFNDFFDVIKANHENIYYAPYTQDALSLKNQIVRSDGSSFSAAFVSGTIANLLSQGKDKQEVLSYLSNFFGETEIVKKRNIFFISYEKYQKIINNSYTLLGLGTVIAFVLYIALGIIICSKSKKDRDIFLKQLLWNAFILIILAYLVLPTQM